MVLSVYFIVQVAYAWRRLSWQRTVRRYAVPSLITGALVLFPIWALGGDAPPLPPKRTYSSLPSDAIAVNATFDGVTLVGWRPIRQWPAASEGWIEVTRSYTVELFWEVPEPTDEDYQFYLAYIDEGTRYAAVDRAIGEVSYPPLFTDAWEPGTLHGEIVSVRVPRGTPLAQQGQIVVGVYRFDRMGLIHNVPMTRPVEQPNLTLQRVAVFDEKEIPPAPELPPANINFGDQIMLLGYELTPEALRMSWQAMTNVTRDYSLFVHIVDERGESIPTQDGPPVPELVTSTWMAGYPLAHTITLPELSPGQYSVYIGLYDTETGDRLAVDAPNYRLHIGDIVVE
jgi:hypothetical protein